MKKLLNLISVIIPDKLYLRIRYFLIFKKRLNLKNPQTFNEKLQWLKLNNRDESYTKMVDKYEVKEYVANIIGDDYIIPTLGVYDQFDDIDFDKLPQQFVIKCTHDSCGLAIVKDKSKMNVNEIRNKINKSLKNNYYYLGREWPYKNVKPRIIIEPYLEDKKTKELRDYKFFTFSGKVKLMYVASNRQGEGEVCFDFYDNKFNHLDIINVHPLNPIMPEKPINFDKMIKLAEKLSKNMSHLRVDFYEVNGKMYFGELTFYHCCGFYPFTPEKWDKIIGDYLKI